MAAWPDGLAVDATGDGFPVVMIHGLGGTSNTFQPLVQALGGHRVVRPDMPGSGRSDPPGGRLDVETLADTAASLIDAVGGRAHLAGHSLGTLVCQWVAARWPGKVAAMVLFGALTEPPDSARDGLAERARAARRDGMADIADAIVANTVATATHESSPAAVAFVRESILRQPPEGYARTCEALARARAADWSAIAAPTLIVAGAADPVAPPSMARRLGEAIAGARVETLERCGHWTPIERPKECARLTAGFLQTHMI